MCGGYSLISAKNTIKKRFNAELPQTPFSPNYNARPGQHLPVILNGNRHTISLAFWGFKPHWAMDGKAKAVINSRAETIAQKRYFSDSFKSRRCLVLADSFYEWKKLAGGKQPYRILLKNDGPFAMAGIWDTGADNHGEILPVFSIITVPANKTMLPIHERMPAILLPEQEEKWLSAGTNPDQAEKLLQPYPDGLLSTYPVSKLVNSPVNNGPDVIKAIVTDK
jgi:putative SOS response-associated peptidase YedK